MKKSRMQPVASLAERAKVIKAVAAKNDIGAMNNDDLEERMRRANQEPADSRLHVAVPSGGWAIQNPKMKNLSPEQIQNLRQLYEKDMAEKKRRKQGSVGVPLPPPLTAQSSIADLGMHERGNEEKMHQQKMMQRRLLDEQLMQKQQLQEMRRQQELMQNREIIKGPEGAKGNNPSAIRHSQADGQQRHEQRHHPTNPSSPSFFLGGAPSSSPQNGRLFMSALAELQGHTADYVAQMANKQKELREALDAQVAEKKNPRENGESKNRKSEAKKAEQRLYHEEQIRQSVAGVEKGLDGDRGDMYSAQARGHSVIDHISSQPMFQYPQSNPPSVHIPPSLSHVPFKSAAEPRAIMRPSDASSIRQPVSPSSIQDIGHSPIKTGSHPFMRAVAEMQGLTEEVRQVKEKRQSELRADLDAQIKEKAQRNQSSRRLPSPRDQTIPIFYSSVETQRIQPPPILPSPAPHPQLSYRAPDQPNVVYITQPNFVPVSHQDSRLYQTQRNHQGLAFVPTQVVSAPQPGMEYLSPKELERLQRLSTDMSSQLQRQTELLRHLEEKVKEKERVLESRAKQDSHRSRRVSSSESKATTASAPPPSRPRKSQPQPASSTSQKHRRPVAESRFPKIEERRRGVAKNPPGKPVPKKREVPLSRGGVSTTPDVPLVESSRLIYFAGPDNYHGED